MMRQAPLALVLAVCAIMSGCATTAPLSSADDRRLAGRTFVITGASSGFGRGVALKLAAHHANVVLAARRTDVLEEVAGQARAAGGQALVVTTDVSRPEDVERLADAAVQRFGRIDVWINDAGVGAIGRFEEIPVADYSRLIDVNYKGVVYGSHAAMRRFRGQHSGTLINLGSVDSEVPLAYQAVYAGTKAAVLGLDQALIQEIRLSGERGIKVVTVMPWATDTPWWRHAANYSGGSPRMAAMDGPDKVVDAIVRVSLHPQAKLPVGWKAQGAYTSHRIFPGLTEAISANINHKYQIKDAPPAAPTSGSVQQPMLPGQGVADNVRARIRAENEARKAGQARAYNPLREPEDHSEDPHPH